MVFLLDTIGGMTASRRRRLAALAPAVLLSLLFLTVSPAVADRAHPSSGAKSCTPTPMPSSPHAIYLPPQKQVVDNNLARCQGGFSYLDRPSAVRTVLHRMYANDQSYTQVSALFVDRLPGDKPGSVRLFVSQPRQSVAAIYSNASGSGAPLEIRRAYGQNMDLYSPAAGVFTTDTRVLQPQPLPPLQSLPPSIQQGDYTGVSFADATSTRGAAALADLFLQPSGLITSALFTHKIIRLVGVATFGGRSTWVLRGSQIPTMPLAAGEPHSWLMWVDRNTGIVLRCEYLAHNRPVGQAVMQRVRIDGAGASPGGGDVYEGWTVPASARYVAPMEYGTAQSSGGSGPWDWAHHHLDIVLQIAFIAVLVLIWWVVGRLQPPEARHEMQNA